MRNPLLSVVMPVYNAACFLEQSVKSILGQTFGDFEFIIIDDGSTDGSLEILQFFKEKDRRVLICSQSHQGIAPARNQGSRLARGRYVAVMDADDISMPDRFQRQVYFLENNPEIALVGGAITMIDEKGKYIRQVVYPIRIDEIKRNLLIYNCISQPTVMMRKKVFEKLGGYRRCFDPAEDYDLWLRMSEQYPLANLPETLLHYRCHLGQISQRKLEAQSLGILTALCAARLRRGRVADGLDKQRTITPEVLKRLGITEEMVNSAFVATSLSWAELALESGDVTNARFIMDRALTNRGGYALSDALNNRIRIIVPKINLQVK
ncbi:MAG: hypothetical protein AUJ71_01170 [Candidatus Omnitrophica bacterium CG1_02_49_16]|nr:MAG: hypothetical protein AUJ71_01170 [Candidatus Omnitrophica bacterium CG1_02_49_16]